MGHNKNALQGEFGKTIALVSSGLLVIGLVLAFSGAALPLGIGLIVAGAAGLATTAAVNWDSVEKWLSKAWGTIKRLAMSSGMLAIGVVLLFSGVGAPLGLEMIKEAVGSLIAGSEPNWDAITEKIKEPFNKIKNWWTSTVEPWITNAKTVLSVSLQAVIMRRFRLSATL